jgi:hypothetical protein
VALIFGTATENIAESLGGSADDAGKGIGLWLTLLGGLLVLAGGVLDRVVKTP